MKAGAPRSPCRNGDEVRRAAGLSMKGTDRTLRARQTNIASSAGARRMNAAVPIRSNLLRLEHRLQTVVNGDAGAAAISLSCWRHLATPLRLQPSPPIRAPHFEFRLPCSFKGIAGCSFVSMSAPVAPKRSKAGLKTRARLRFHRRFGTIAAAVPDALTGQIGISPSATPS